MCRAPGRVTATRGPPRHIEEILDGERGAAQRPASSGLDDEAFDERIGYFVGSA
jgi:hypothetical protein